MNCFGFGASCFGFPCFRSFGFRISIRFLFYLFKLSLFHFIKAFFNLFLVLGAGIGPAEMKEKRGPLVRFPPGVGIAGQEKTAYDFYQQIKQ